MLRRGCRRGPRNVGVDGQDSNDLLVNLLRHIIVEDGFLPGNRSMHAGLALEPVVAIRAGPILPVASCCKIKAIAVA